MSGKMWGSFSTFSPSKTKTVLNLLGEYDCKLDSKGRMMLPKGLQKQLDGQLSDGFVINRDIFSKALVIYPWAVWQEQSEQVNRLNKFVRKNVEFIRKFNSGATRVELDGQGRLLIPAALLAYSKAKKDIKLNALNDRIELWSKKNYEQMLKEDIDMGSLAEEVMGGVEPDDE